MSEITSILLRAPDRIAAGEEWTSALYPPHSLNSLWGFRSAWVAYRRLRKFAPATAMGDMSRSEFENAAQVEALVSGACQ